jgi:hypothetical protein
MKMLVTDSTYLSLKNITFKNKYYYLFLFLGTVIALFASPLAPFSSKITDLDSSVFVYCAQHILEGKIMYKDIFDHKGPLLYLFNILGILLGRGNPTGIWFIELVSLFISSLYLYKSLCLFWSKNVSFFSVLFCLVFFTSLIPHGNYAEEYALPFISIAQYYFVSFFKDRKIRYSHFCIIALCFACVLLLKPNTAVVWVVGWILLAFLLLKEKKPANLLKIASISLGIVILALIPLIVYLFLTDSFLDFKFCYWDFNQTYSDLSPARILSRAFRRLYFIPVMGKSNTYIFLGIAVLLLICSYKTYKYKLPVLFYFISVFATSCAISVSYTNFVYYYLLYVPVFSFLYAMALDVIEKHVKSYSFLILFVLFGIFNFEAINYYCKDVRYCYQEKKYANEIVSFINDNTQKDDKIYVLGNHCLFYNLSHRESASKYPYLYPIVNMKKYRDTMIDQFYKDMELNPPKVICELWYESDWIVHKDIPGLTEFLEKNYIKIRNMGGFDCYVRKQNN